MQCGRCREPDYSLKATPERQILILRRSIPYRPLGGGILPQPKDFTIRYRYASAALHGPWRDTEDEALADAVRVGIAMELDGKLTWRVNARVERESGIGALPVWTLPAQRQ